MPVPVSRSRPPCGVSLQCSCEPAGRPSSGLVLSGCAQTALTGWHWWTALCWQPTRSKGKIHLNSLANTHAVIGIHYNLLRMHWLLASLCVFYLSPICCVDLGCYIRFLKPAWKYIKDQLNGAEFKWKTNHFWLCTVQSIVQDTLWMSACNYCISNRCMRNGWEGRRAWHFSIESFVTLKLLRVCAHPS